MNRPIYTIAKSEDQFRLQFFKNSSHLLLESCTFDSFKACEKFLDTLRVHLCFQTNFSRCKTSDGLYAFEIRTCWDDLIATSTGFATRQEREEVMLHTFDANKNAVFVHTSIYTTHIPVLKVA